MPTPISAAAYIEKNALSNTGLFLVLLDIVIPTVTTISICSNTENIIWPSGGSAWSDTSYSVNDLVTNDGSDYKCISAVTAGNSAVTEPGTGSAWATYWVLSSTYAAFPFELDEISDGSKGEVPQINIRVSNVTQALQAYLEQADGGTGSDVTFNVVHTDHLDNVTPEITLAYEVLEVTSDAMWVTFVLGVENIYKKSLPRNRLSKNVCRYREFGGTRCGFDTTDVAYDGNGCDRSLSRCRALFTQIGSPEDSARFGGAPGVGSEGLHV